MIDFSKNHWNEITYCEREDAYGNMLPAEWFILNGPFATKEKAEDHQARLRAELKGTDAEWPEANAAAKIVHDDDLGQYGLKPLNEPKEKKGEDPCICFADGEEWEELQGHDWELMEDGSLRCSNCGIIERGGAMDRLLNL